MRAIPLTAVMLLIACVLTGCTAKPESLRTSSANPVASRSPLVVQVTDPRPSTGAGDLLVPAALSVEVTALVLAQRDGTISQLAAQEGSRVVKGEVIAQLSGDDDLRARLRQAQLQVSQLEVEQREYGALIKVNRNELDRETLLFKQGLTSERDVERAQFKLDAAVLELEKSRVTSQSAQAKVVEVQAELERSTIRAPITGVVVHRYAKLGTNAVKNDKLFEISQLAPLEVRFQVPQTDKLGLGPGSMVGVSQLESDQVVATARIRRIDSVADAASNTIGFLAEVPSRPGLVPGVAVNVHIPRRSTGPGVWIPQTAFPAGVDLRKGSASTIFVAAGDKCAARAVWVNSISGDQVELISGLALGDRVILSPSPELKPGDSVLVKN